MKVFELITALQTFNPDLEVVIQDSLMAPIIHPINSIIQENMFFEETEVIVIVVPSIR